MFLCGGDGGSCRCSNMSCSFVTDDFNRVVLVRPKGDNDTDYINASYIKVSLLRSDRDERGGGGGGVCLCVCLIVCLFVCLVDCLLFVWLLGCSGTFCVDLFVCWSVYIFDLKRQTEKKKHVGRQTGIVAERQADILTERQADRHTG